MCHDQYSCHVHLPVCNVSRIDMGMPFAIQQTRHQTFLSSCNRWAGKDATNKDLLEPSQVLALLIRDFHIVCRRACARTRAMQEGTDCRIPSFGDHSRLPTMEGRDFWQLHAEPSHVQKERPHLNHPVGNTGLRSALHVAEKLDINICSAMPSTKQMRQTSSKDNAAMKDNAICTENCLQKDV